MYLSGFTPQRADLFDSSLNRKRMLTSGSTPKLLFSSSLPEYKGPNHFLSKEEQREERRKNGRRQSAGSVLATSAVAIMSAIAATVPPIVQLVEHSMAQLQQEYKMAGPSDGALLQAADAANGLLLVAKVADKSEILGIVLRKEIREHEVEWLNAMPKESRGDVKEILDAFIQGASYDELESLIVNKVTFRLAESSPLSQINENDPGTPDNLKQLKKLMQTHGTDSFIETEKNKIHFWYLPAQSGKQTILYSNGRGASLKSTANFILEAHKRGYGVMIYEYPGNGDSTGTLSQNGYYQAADSTLQFMQQKLGILQRDILLIGYSMGTNITAHVSARYPGIQDVVLISAMEGFETVYDDVISRYPNTLAAKLAIDSSMLDSFNTTSLFEGAIKNKTILFLYGEQDTYVLPKQTRELYKQAKHDNMTSIYGIPSQTHTSIRENTESVYRIFNLIEQTFPRY